MRNVGLILSTPKLRWKFTKNLTTNFLIIDNTELYHIGASLKDLG